MMATTKKMRNQKREQVIVGKERKVVNTLDRGVVKSEDEEGIRSQRLMKMRV
jgi:hypothetical protein